MSKAHLGSSTRTASVSSQGDSGTQTASEGVFSGQGGMVQSASSKGNPQNAASGQASSRSLAALDGSQAHSLTLQTEMGNEDGQGGKRTSTDSQAEQASQQFPSGSERVQGIAETTTANVAAEASHFAASLLRLTDAKPSASETKPQGIPSFSLSSAKAGPSSSLISSGRQPSALSNQQSYPAQTSAPDYIGGNSQTFAPGDLYITISGQVASLAASGLSLVLDGSTIEVTSYIKPVTTIVTSNSQTFVSTIGSELVIHGQTFSQAPQPTGTTLGAPAGTAAVVTHISGQNSILSINSSPITALVESSHFFVSGATLLPGGPAVTISGTPMSLDPGGSTLVLGSSTILLPAQAAMLTLRSSTLTANSAGQSAIGGQTLTPGAAAIPISGTSISLAISDAYAVLDGSTVSLSGAPLTVGGQVLTRRGSRIYCRGKASEFGRLGYYSKWDGIQSRVDNRFKRRLGIIHCEWVGCCANGKWSDTYWNWRDICAAKSMDRFVGGSRYHNCKFTMKSRQRQPELDSYTIRGFGDPNHIMKVGMKRVLTFLNN